MRFSTLRQNFLLEGFVFRAGTGGTFVFDTVDAMSSNHWYNGTNEYIARFLVDKNSKKCYIWNAATLTHDSMGTELMEKGILHRGGRFSFLRGVVSRDYAKKEYMIRVFGTMELSTRNNRPFSEYTKDTSDANDLNLAIPALFISTPPKFVYTLASPNCVYAPDGVAMTKGWNKE